MFDTTLDNGLIFDFLVGLKDLTKLKSWADYWLIKLSTIPNKRLHLVDIECTDRYNINNIELENVESITDLGVIFDSHFKCGFYMSEKKLIKLLAFLVL